MILLDHCTFPSILSGNHLCIDTFCVRSISSSSINRSILVMWVRCRFLDTAMECLRPGCINMLCPWARHLIRIVSADSAVK